VRIDAGTLVWDDPSEAFPITVTDNGRSAFGFLCEHCGMMNHFIYEHGLMTEHMACEHTNLEEMKLWLNAPSTP
jgi:hypothetical protein